MSQSAVIDNASLVYLSHLNLKKPVFQYLKNLFNTIYIPTEVVKEYAAGINKEPHRKWILDRLNPEQGFYRFCTTYDTFILVMVEKYKGIDKGEAETFAQLKKVNANIIISDDVRFIETLKKLDGSIRVYSTLHILSWLEHAGFIADWNFMICEIYKIRKFNSMDLRNAYIETAKYLGLHIPKKQISAKCSLTRLLEKDSK